MEINNGYKNNHAGELLELEDSGLGAILPTTLYNGRVMCEISEDFILPEYLPEIRKLLRVTGVVSSPEKYVAAKSLGISGEIEYCALYVGSDARLHTASFIDAYEMSVPFAENTEMESDCEVRSSVTVDVDGIVGRVTGARKINIKTRIASDVKVIGEMRMIGGGNISRDGHMQLLVKSCEYTKELFGESLESEAVDELELSNGDRYICSDCCVFVDGATAFAGYVECRGTVIMRHLIEREDGKTYDIVRKIPFNETVEVDGIGAGTSIIAHGTCAGVSKTAKESDYEDPFDAISVSAQIKLSVVGYKGQTFRYVKDAYSTSYKCENHVKEFEIPRILACANKNMTLSETTDCVTPDTDGAEICNVTAHAEVENVALSVSGKYVINGNCEFSVVLFKNANSKDENGVENREYFSREIDIPFKYECAEGGAIPDISMISVEAIDPRVRFDGERLELGCELMISYGFLGLQGIKSVENAVLGDAIARNKSRYTVCYPSTSDTLWSVSKKYNASVEVTARSNGMDVNAEPDVVGVTDGAKYMIV